MRIFLTGAGVLLFIGLVRNQTPMMLLALLLVLAVAVAAVWAHYATQGLTFRRFFDPPRIFPGQETDYVVEIVNRKRLPLPWTEITDRLPAALTVVRHLTSRPPPPAGEGPQSPPPPAWEGWGEGPPQLREPSQGEWRRSSSIALGWYERVVLRQRITCQQRGEYLVGPTDIQTGDPLGLFQENLHFAAQPSLLVYPRVARLEAQPPASRFPFGTIRARPPALEDPSWFAGIRDYRPGDSRRLVDWKATARRQRLQTRIFTPTTLTNVVVALNVQTMPLSWQGHDREKLENAIAVAAALAQHLMEGQSSVGLAVNGSGLGIEGFQVFTPPSRKPSQWTDMLATLGRLTPLSTLAFDRFIRRVAAHFPYGASLAVVAGYLDQESADELAGLVERGHSVALWFLGSELPCRLPASIPVILLPHVEIIPAPVMDQARVGRLSSHENQLPLLPQREREG